VGLGRAPSISRSKTLPKASPTTPMACPAVLTALPASFTVSTTGVVIVRKSSGSATRQTASSTPSTQVMASRMSPMTV